MKIRFFLYPLFIFVLLSFFSTTAQADGFIIPTFTPCPDMGCPPGPRPIHQLVVRYHHVTVTIDDQLAVTHVDQVFYNPNDWMVEGTYIFPLPVDSVVNNFVLWVDGKPIEGKVLDAEQARQTYLDTVQEMRDPALLEYLGRGAVQASIFPIPPQGERRIELEYSQALTAENGLIRYIYPLNTEKFSAKPLEDVSVSVLIKSKQPIRAVYSPTHKLDTVRENETQVKVGYEDNDVLPNMDFALYYSVGSSEAFHLLTYRDPGDQDPDGFFMMLLAPSTQRRSPVINKDVLIVLDHSGSMEGDKFNMARSALRYILTHLNPDDRFYLTAFSTGVESFSSELQPTGRVSDALNWVENLIAEGSTDINRALLETVSVVDKERPTYMIFLTDGLPTEGETDSGKILDNMKSDAPSNLRLFAFGVGYDVDTFLLDSLTQEHHGLSTYVKEGEALDEVVSAFYSRISTPIMTDLELEIDKVSSYDIYPNPLPDLFEGTQVIVIGRYHDGGKANITLRGKVNGEEQSYRYSGLNFIQDSRGLNDLRDKLPRLWATRKIGYLLNKFRLETPDQETIDQIIRLSIRYGIVTPYTSFLVTEDMPLGGEAQKDIAQETFQNLQAAPPSVSGAPAVQSAATQGAMSQAEIPQAVPSSEGQVIQNVGARTFILKDGIWMDTAFDPEKMTTLKVSFLSKDYFALAENRPDVAGGLALGNRVIIVIDGVAYEVVEEDVSNTPVVLPNTPVIPTSINIDRTSNPTSFPPPQKTPSPQGEDDSIPVSVIAPIVFIASITGGGLILVILGLIFLRTRK